MTMAFCPGTCLEAFAPVFRNNIIPRRAVFVKSLPRNPRWIYFHQAALPL